MVIKVYACRPLAEATDKVIQNLVKQVLADARQAKGERGLNVRRLKAAKVIGFDDTDPKFIQPVYHGEKVSGYRSNRNCK